MKNKIAFTVVLVGLFFTHSFAQKSIVKLQIGYGIPLANDLLANSAATNSAGSTTYTGVYGSYGSGVRIEGGYIYLLNTHLSLELDGAYLIGKQVNATYTSPSFSQTQSSASHFYEVSPLLRMNLGGTKVKPYAAVGPVFGFGNIVSSYFSGGTNGSDVERQYTGSGAVGAKSVVGTEFTQGRFIFYAQVTMINMNYGPSKSEYTRYSLGGVDQLVNMTISQKQVVYKRTATTGGTQDPNQPTEQLKFYTPLNSISMNVGVMFKL
jgi:hypothetical protein